MKQGLSSEANSHSASQEILRLKEPEISLPRSQDPSNRPHS
jgi:hypothetical protein